MWQLWIGLLALIVTCAVINQATVNTIFRVSRHVTEASSFGVWLYSIFFFPGTVIHELSHYGVAHLLGVRTGEMHLLPHMEDNNITLGYVKVAKSDMIRSFFIAAAPFYIGFTILVIIVFWYFRPLQSQITDLSSILPVISSQVTTWTFWVVVYFLIAISHALFPSKADQKEMVFGLVLLALAIVLVFLFHTTFQLTETATAFLHNIVYFLLLCFGVVCIINLIFLAILSLLQRGVEKVI